MTAQEAEKHYVDGVSGVTQEKYCRKQVRMGMSPQVCAQRFSDYQADVQGKGSKWLNDWLNG